jgi:hypothetical protein
LAPFPVLPSSPKRPDMPDQRSVRAASRSHPADHSRAPPRRGLFHHHHPVPWFPTELSPP